MCTKRARTPCTMRDFFPEDAGYLVCTFLGVLDCARLGTVGRKSRDDTRVLLREKKMAYLCHVRRFEAYAAKVHLFEPHVYDALQRNGMATNMLRDLDVHTAGYYWTQSLSGSWMGKLGEDPHRVHPDLESRLDFMAEHGDDLDAMEAFLDDDSASQLSTFVFSVESIKRKNARRGCYMWERHVYVNEEFGPFPLNRDTVRRLVEVLAQEHQHVLQGKKAVSVTPDGLVPALMNDAWGRLLASMEDPRGVDAHELARAWKPHVARGVLPPLFPAMTYFEGAEQLEMPHIPIVLSEDFVDVLRPLHTYPGPWSILPRSTRKRKHAARESGTTTI